MPPTAITAIRAVGIPVTDQDRALSFYVDVLGLEKTLDAPVPELGSRWIEVAPPGGAVSIALVKSTADYEPGVETGIRLATDDAAALYGYLRDQQVSVGDFLEWPNMPPMFVMRDRDGNSLEIVG